MKYRTLPGTDLQLSAIGLGCWTLAGADFGADPGLAGTDAAGGAALERGIQFFDTAPIYGDGRADEVTRIVGPGQPVGRGAGAPLGERAGPRRVEELVQRAQARGGGVHPWPGEQPRRSTCG